MLSVLTEKTKGNLTDKEQRLLQNALFELRMMFMEITNSISTSAHNPSASLRTLEGGLPARARQRQHSVSRQWHIYGCAHAGLYLPRLHFHRSARPAPSPLNRDRMAGQRRLEAASRPHRHRA